MPLALARGHFARRAQQHRHVQIVATSMHHAYVLTLRIGRPHGGGVLEPRLFLHRQAIHIRPDQQSRPRAVLQHGSHAKRLRPIFVFAHMLGNQVAQLAQLGSHVSRRLFFMPG